MVAVVAVGPGRMARLRAAVREVAHETRRTQRGHDLWVISAAVTFYALVALVPSLVVAARVLAALVGDARLLTLGGAFFTGAFVSGFLQGFVLFLAIPVDLGAPFGGFTQVGGAVAVALWLWVFTALTITGYSITLALDTRRARLAAAA